MGILDLMNGIEAAGDRGRARGQQTALGRLFSQASTAPREQRSGLLAQMGAISPQAAFDAESHFGKMDDNARKQLGQYAAAFSALPADQKAAAYPQLAEMGRTLGLPVPQGDYQPAYDAGIAQLGQAFGGASAGAAGVQSTFTDDAGNRVAIMRDGSTKVLGRSDPGMANQSITIEGPNGEPIQLTFNKRTGSYADVPGAVGMGAGEKAAVTEAAKQDVDLSFAPRFQAIETGGAIERARGSAQAQADVTRQTAQRQKAQAFDQFETAMKGVESGLGGTTTNPVAGSLPALTANQQIAEGSIAAMAPILKQLFRVAGEGTFTDRDQALLMDMLPTRKDHPEARKAKIANIRAIVAAKLGATPSAAGTDNDAARRKALLDKY